MGTLGEDESLAAFLGSVNVGDVLSGVTTEVTRCGVTVLLDDFSASPVGVIGALDLSWQAFGRSPDEALDVGARVCAEVIAVDQRNQRVELSLAATENPCLWTFLKGLRPGQQLSGTVAAIERFGVFVNLDDGPAHPVFPGVGFITHPELSWLRFEEPSEIVSVGQHITCKVIVFDTHNGEARLSLRAMRPDPFQQFARQAHVGDALHSLVTGLVPFGAFVSVGNGIVGLVHLTELAASPIDRPEEAVRVGDPVTVIVTNIDPRQRRLSLSRRRAQ